VARPLVAMLFLGWVWRLVLVYVLFWRIARLPLSLVPTHPDRTGGLDFIGYMPTAFVPLVFALGCVLGAHWAHDLVYHDVTVKALQWQMGILVVVAVALSMSPLLVFAGPLRRARMRALLDMGAIAGSQGRLLQRRWTGGREVRDDEAPDAPALDPAALYGTFEQMRPIPFSKSTLAPLVLAAALPMLAVAAIQLPVRDLLKTLLGALL